MDWREALDIVVARTKHERFRVLCADDHPEHELHRRRMVEVATGVPAEYPSWGTMAGNALQALGRVVAAAATGEAVTVDRAEQERRLAICRGCEHFDPDQERCRRCGCGMQLKTRLAQEHCPLPEPKW